MAKKIKSRILLDDLDEEFEDDLDGRMRGKSRVVGSRNPQKYNRFVANGRGKSTIDMPREFQQRVSVKGSYSPNLAGGNWRQHGYYLERDGAGLNGERPEGFSRTGEVAIAETLHQWQEQGDERLFKFIISPEFGEKANLQVMVRNLMKQVEEDLDTKLDWVAISHHNTEHPHVHICIRGKDEKGRQLTIHPAYIKQGFRMRAQQEMTRQIGYRTEKDLMQAREREITVSRVCSLDRELRKLQSKDHLITFPTCYSPKDLLRQRHLKKRLVYLETMGLAKRVGLLKDQWEMDPNLENIFKVISLGKDRQKAMSQHAEWIADKDMPFTTPKLKEGEFLIGKVIGCGQDERNDRLYTMLETIEGKIAYVLHHAQEGEPVFPGQLVKLTAKFARDQDDKVAGIVLENKQLGAELPSSVIDAEIEKLLSKGQRLPKSGKMPTLRNKLLDAMAKAWVARGFSLDFVPKKRRIRQKRLPVRAPVRNKKDFELSNRK